MFHRLRQQKALVLGDGIGAQVRVYAGDLTLLDAMHSGRSYQSDFGRRLYFGLGERTRIDRIEVRWLGGKKEIYAVPQVDRRILLVEGKGSPS